MDVLVSVEENPRVSTRDIASNMGISNQTVQAMLRKHKFKSYIPQKVQVLEENDRAIL
jgi:predicted transcriptional regulator